MASVAQFLFSTKPPATTLPKRMTGISQLADTHWFAIIKRAYRALWNQWYGADLRTYTPAGNMRSPSYMLIISWLSHIWEALDPELIRNSFDQTGISNENENHLTSTLRSILDSFPVIEYLEDIEPDIEPEEPVDGVNADVLDDDDDEDYEQAAVSESDNENDSDLVNLSESLNKSTIEDDETVLAAESQRDEAEIAIAQHNFRVDMNSQARQSLRRSSRVANNRLLKKISFK